MANETILVIDDDENDLALLERLLERNGYEVSTATSGVDGLRKFDERAPDLVMVDFRMPGMDGYEVSKKVKEIDGNVPVLILTGADSSNAVVEGLDAGADDYVTKSSEIEVVLARVRALLRTKSHQDQIVEQSEQLRNLYEELRVKSDEVIAMNNRYQRELAFARKVQEALLPPPSMSSLGTEVRSFYLPSETLSGDFYDYFEHDESLILFVADVSGHGLPASILTSLLKSYLKSQIGRVSSPGEFMSGLNSFLSSASLPSQFATAVLMEIRENHVRFANAAHTPFLVYRPESGDVEEIERPGLMLGAFGEATFEDRDFEVEPGTMLFVYTDGLTDRISKEGEFYSTGRIASILAQSNSDDLSSVHDRIVEDITSFAGTEELKDDVAFVLVRFAD